MEALTTGTSLSLREVGLLGKKGVRRVCDLDVEGTPCEPERRPSASPIISFNKSIDALLNGGARAGSVLEIVGAPGTGKTQLCLQFAVNATIPRELGGREGRVAFVDVDASFCAERAHQTASAMVRHVRKMRGSLTTTEEVLRRIRVFAPADDVEVLAALELIDDDADLVVVDSLAAPFRANNRPRLIARAALLLARHAHKGAAVVVTNHISWGRPALGESWSHAADTRVLLERNNVATILKSPTCPRKTATFRIDDRGFR
ncbi:hypothetical protein CTAYLR_000546 [Chrysophaeum taylorii]|uniref:DNA repair protein RAD51 homolog 3 n=1 Tax=Chrysophaeum taylorii TaxID=2483200 RepID=A0AAD7UGU9_9STRA|nr:hypothetical protein CTAYLR_000546 [Chrysophaeum taylorii]